MNETKAPGIKPEPPRSVSRAGEVFRTFLKLGLTSFGGPVAHLGYFRDELVLRRRWIDDPGYADLVALCQFLPGPASSQVGFALGLLRGGPLGGLAAWSAFTLPSAVLLILFAYGAAALDGPVSAGLLHGLKVVAVAIVAQAVFGMARTLAPDWRRAGIAIGALLIVTSVSNSLGQVTAIVLGGLSGLALCRGMTAPPGVRSAYPIAKRTGMIALGLFFLLLILLPLLAASTSARTIALFDSFYRAGALVFGGGHVVLPLLEAELVRSGWMSADAFLAGYGAAQAVPGPLFTFAAYLGAAMQAEPNGVWGALICLIAVFLPGLLLLIGALPFWNALRTLSPAQAAMRGTNAAVVGLLGAALYDPVWKNAILGPVDAMLALAGFLMLTLWKVAPWIVVALMALAGSVSVLLTTAA
jgi:chromate transporter